MHWCTDGVRFVDHARPANLSKLRAQGEISGFGHRGEPLAVRSATVTRPRVCSNELRSCGAPYMLATHSDGAWSRCVSLTEPPCENFTRLHNVWDIAV